MCCSFLESLTSVCLQLQAAHTGASEHRRRSSSTSRDDSIVTKLKVCNLKVWITQENDGLTVNSSF